MSSPLLKASWALGLLLFAHAAYSAYEFISTTKRSASLHAAVDGSSPTGALPASVAGGAIPLDILVELLAGLALHTACSVVSVRGKLRAVAWREWARTQSSWEEDDDFDARDRPGFTDIIARRKAYAARRQANEKSQGAGKKVDTPSIVITSADT